MTDKTSSDDEKIISRVRDYRGSRPRTSESTIRGQQQSQDHYWLIKDNIDRYRYIYNFNCEQYHLVGCIPYELRLFVGGNPFYGVSKVTGEVVYYGYFGE